VVALTQATGLSKSGAEAALRRHIGICVDTCHAAVEYESADDILDDLAAAELQVGKIQVTAGLRVAPVTAEQLAFLREFADDVYLHQVVARRGDTLVRFADLPQAFADARTHVSCDDMGRVVSADEWRVHFHVPIFTEPERFGTTHAFVRRFIEALKRRQSCRHLEVETYTWDVLPAAWRERGVVDAIAQELRWVERLWNE
jgi:hypothetical protein